MSIANAANASALSSAQASANSQIQAAAESGDPGAMLLAQKAMQDFAMMNDALSNAQKKEEQALKTAIGNIK